MAFAVWKQGSGTLIYADSGIGNLIFQGIGNLLIVTALGGHLLGVTRNGKTAMIHQDSNKEVDHGQRIGCVWEYSYHLFVK